jgi:hypothetical protein
MAVTRQVVVEAIQSRSVVEMTYEGDRGVRLVHPHILYRTSTGKECVDSYQVAGFTVDGGQLPDWRPFNLQKITRFEPLDDFFQLAPGYKPSSPKYRNGVIARAS